MKLNFKILDGIDLGINGILFHGKYAEAQGEERYLMEFRHVISSMVVKKQFSVKKPSLILMDDRVIIS